VRDSATQRCSGCGRFGPACGTNCITTRTVVSPSSELARHVGEVLESARGPRIRRSISEALGWKSPVPLSLLEKGCANPTLGHLEKVAAGYGGHLEVRFVADECGHDECGDACEARSG